MGKQRLDYVADQFSWVLSAEEDTWVAVHAKAQMPPFGHQHTVAPVITVYGLRQCLFSENQIGTFGLICFRA
jgi:hypothetical protein